MNVLKRKIAENINNLLFQGKIIVIYGARQVGKTTLITEIRNKNQEDSIYLNCDEPDIRDELTNKTSTQLKFLIGNSSIVIIDEAQRVKNIGVTLKLLADNFPERQIIATGSSSFDLSNEIKEPLTGRKYEFHLYPFSLAELSHKYTGLEINRLLEERIIYGMYPEVALAEDKRKAENNLLDIARSYLFKDLLQFNNIKNHEKLEKLLKALALQIGQEISYNELSNSVGIDKNTVASYIQLLEKAFVVYRLKPFHKNSRTELKKNRKIFFYDTGIRNAVINNFNHLDLRQDTGNLWENFIISEFKKQNENFAANKNEYFWRSTSGQEIDYIETKADKIRAFEVKWQKEKMKIPTTFKKLYPDAEFNLINNKNYFDYFLS